MTGGVEIELAKARTEIAQLQRLAEKQAGKIDSQAKKIDRIERLIDKGTGAAIVLAGACAFIGWLANVLISQAREGG